MFPKQCCLVCAGLKKPEALLSMQHAPFQIFVHAVYWAK